MVPIKDYQVPARDRGLTRESVINTKSALLYTVMDTNQGTERIKASSIHTKTSCVAAVGGSYRKVRNDWDYSQRGRISRITVPSLLLLSALKHDYTSSLGQGVASEIHYLQCCKPINLLKKEKNVSGAITHARAHAHTRTHTHTLTHMIAHRHTHNHACARAHTHTHTHTHM